MEQLNSNIERVIEANSTIEVFNTGAFYALVRAYKYVVVDNKPVKEKINVPFSFDLYNKDNDKISTGTISPGEKATFKVPTYKMVISNTYDYEVHIVYSFGSGTVSQLKTDLELNTEDIAALTAYDKQDFDQLVSINEHTTESYEELDKITKLIEAETAIDKTPHLIKKYPIFIDLKPDAPRAYFNVIELPLEANTPDLPTRPYFINHIDISLDYSQCHGYETTLCVTNTLNPGMSFGKYEKLKTLQPDTVGDWKKYDWTVRADTTLPTRSKSLVIDNGILKDDGHFKVDINEIYGTGTYFTINNFILRTDIALMGKVGAADRKVAIRKYTQTHLNTGADITESVLTGTYNFADYNRCASQKPINSAANHMVVVDVCVYGYLLPDL